MQPFHFPDNHALRRSTASDRHVHRHATPTGLFIYLTPHPQNPNNLNPLNISDQASRSMAHNAYRHDGHHQTQLSHQVARTTTAVTLGGSLMVLSSFTMAATMIGLVLVTPLLVIFSPVLFPAIFTFFLIFAGFLTSGWLVATGTFVLYWMYRYVTGKHPVFADKLDWARDRIAGAAMEVKQKAEQMGHDQMRVKEGGRSLY